MNSFMVNTPPSKVFLLDKDPDISSFKALEILKKQIGTKKIGHAGTLDPFATGLLVAMSRKMTKVASLVSNMPKEYTAVIRFGEETDTWDRSGKVVARSDIPEYTTIKEAAKNFQGEISQVPPSFSAIKLKGKRAYKSAREGLSFTLPERRVHIYDFELLSWHPPDIAVKIRCSKGTYIRSIAHYLGLTCGSRAHCAELRRTAIGSFSVERASLNGMSALEFFELIQIPVYTTNQSVATAMCTGQPLSSIRGYTPPHEDMALILDERGVEIALLTKKDGQWMYQIVFD